ncbi:MAG: hypothetical protein ACOY3X_13695, partial [Pseudomonadota bacterium]
MNAPISKPVLVLLLLAVVASIVTSLAPDRVETADTDLLPAFSGPGDRGHAGETFPFRRPAARVAGNLAAPAFGSPPPPALPSPPVATPPPPP